MCSVGFFFFFYYCTEMFPNKPNLRTRKAFFTGLKGAYVVYIDIYIFLEIKMLALHRVAEIEPAKGFFYLMRIIITMNKMQLPLVGRYIDLFLHQSNL